MSERAAASFHIVTEGTCWLTVEGINAPPVLLTEGDLVILPHGHTHIMSDHPETPVTMLEVATSIGYDSEVAFSKAFRRYFGIAPGAYRQGRRSPAGAGTREKSYPVQ